MRYVALAVDYDGTLAEDGQVLEATIAAHVALRASGRRLIMVTGRELPDLCAAFPRGDLFDLIVADNGGLMFCPATGAQSLLGPPPPQSLIEALRARGVVFSVGAVILATTEAFLDDVRAVLGELGLGREVILNKGAVMLLPPGVNKGTGIARAATELAIDLSAIVAMGDAENDAPFLASCGVGVAVANALPSIKAQADIVTRGARGEGVIEIIGRLLDGDLAVL